MCLIVVIGMIDELREAWEFEVWVGGNPESQEMVLYLR